MFTPLISLLFLFVWSYTSELSFRCCKRYPMSLSMTQVETMNIERMFNEKLLNRTYYRSYRDVDDNFLIINDPSITRDHPLLGIDIDAEVQRIRTARSLPSSRLKAMFAVVTGMGRGKTRLLVELDQEMKKYPNMCSIAITFNHNWDIPEFSKLKNSNPELQYAAAIISRIISMHYRISFKDSINLTDELVLKVDPDTSATTLIRECIRSIIAQLRRNDPNVDHFVLLVDESMKIVEKFGLPTVHNILRKALLDSPVLGTDDMPLYVDLVMSSLDVKATGVSDSGRKILAIATPTELDTNEVLDTWVKRHVAIYDDSAMTDSGRIEMKRNVRKLKSLIACLSPVPRSLQFMVTVLAKMGGNIIFDSLKMKELYENTMAAVNDQYPKSQVLPAQYGKALLFGEKIVLDDTFMKLIKESVFVNSLKTLSAGMVLCPETSIVSMQRLNIATSRMEAQFPVVIVNVIESLLENLMIPSGIEDAGKPLEIIMRGLIDARLQVLVDILNAENLTGESRKTFTLQSLLMMKSRPLFDDEDAMSKSSPLFLETHKMRISPGACTQTGPFPRTNFCNPKLKGQLVDGNQDFLQKANRVTLRSPVSYVKITLHPLECADGMWLFRDEKDAPFVLAVDCKSRQIGKPTRDRPVACEGVLDELPGQGSQAVHFLNVAKEATAWPAEEVKGESMLDALRCGNFLYVYLSTETDSTFAVGSHILHMGRADSERFLSFFKAYYTLHRSSTSSADAEATRDKGMRIVEESGSE